MAVSIVAIVLGVNVNNEMVNREYIQSNIKEGWVLNPNDKIVEGIIKGINRNGGECPCVNDSIDKKCLSASKCKGCYRDFKP